MLDSSLRPRPHTRQMRRGARPGSLEKRFYSCSAGYNHLSHIRLLCQFCSINKLDRSRRRVTFVILPATPWPVPSKKRQRFILCNSYRGGFAPLDSKQPYSTLMFSRKERKGRKRKKSVGCRPRSHYDILSNHAVLQSKSQPAKGVPAISRRLQRTRHDYMELLLLCKPQHRNLREMLVVCRKNISLLNRARRYPYVVLGNHPPRTLKCLVYLGVV